MAQNPFDQFDAPAVRPAPAQAGVAVPTAPATATGNPFDQFEMAPPSGVPRGQLNAPAMPPDQMPGSRQTYTAAEVPGAALQNLPASAQRFASGVVGGLQQLATSPVETVSGLVGGALDIGAGALQNVLPQNVVDVINKFDFDSNSAKRAVEMANRAGGVIAKRYGSYENVKRTLAEDPVGAAADLSTLLGVGALGTGSQVLSRASTLTNPLTAVTAPVTAVAKRGQAKMTKQQKLNAVRDDTLREGQAQGFVVTPGSVTPTVGNILLERIGGKTRVEQLAGVRNQQVTDSLARRAIGLPDDAPLTRDTMRDIRAQEYNAGYAPLANIGRVTADVEFKKALQDVTDAFTGASKSFKGAAPQDVQKLIKPYNVADFDAADAIAATRTLRENARNNFQKGEGALGRAQIAVSNALEAQLERSLQAANNPQAAALLDEFRNSRKRMAVSHAIEDAIVEGTGSVDARKLASDFQKGKLLTGELETAAKFANTFKRVVTTPGAVGTPAAQTFGGMGIGTRGMIGGAAGGAFGGGLGGVALGTAAAVAPELVSLGAQRFMLSGPAQRGALPAYNRYNSLARNIGDPELRNALIAAQTLRAADEPTDLGTVNVTAPRRNMLMVQ
jgi:hypothetical protein